jgi:hypothetical protein
MLAGCSHDDATSGGPNGGGGGLTEGKVLAKPGDATYTAAKALQDPATGKELAADSTTSTAGDFSIKPNNAGGLDMKVNGQTISFAGSDVNAEGNGWEKDDGKTKLTSFWGGDVGKIVDGTDTNYVQVWRYRTGSGNDLTRGFATIGVETPTSEVGTMTAKATYKGDARVDMAMADHPGQQIQVKGDMTLNADFTAKSVDGSIDNLKGRYVEGDAGTGAWEKASSGSVALNKGTISGNGFSGGTLTQKNVAFSDAVTQGTEVNIDGSTYSGRFYGPNADQVGGVINVKGTVATDDGSKPVVGQGFIAGNKQ